MDKKEQRVQSLDRTFDILELLSSRREGITLTEISKILGLHKSTVHRLVSALQSRSYVERSESDLRFRLGPAFIHMSSRYLNRIELNSEASPYLHRLSKQLGSTVFLAIRKDDEVVYVDKVEEFAHNWRLAIVGQRRPFYCTSIGKALLLKEEINSIKQIFENEERIAQTEKTLVSIDDLITQMIRFQNQGWTIDDEEYEEGILCIGAPIFDYKGRIIAAISSVWNGELQGIDREIVGPLVSRTAQEISSRFGYIR